MDEASPLAPPPAACQRLPQAAESGTERQPVPEPDSERGGRKSGEQGRGIPEEGPQSRSMIPPPGRQEPEAEAKPATTPIHKVRAQGCLFWEVELRKEDESQKFGISHTNGKSLFTRTKYRKEMLEGFYHNDGSDRFRGPEVLYVKKVANDGVIGAFNEVHREAELLPGDRIVEVNGRKDIPGMQEAFHSMNVHLTLMRYPERFIINLAKEHGLKLGLRFELPKTADIHELRVTEVVPGGLLDQINTHHMRDGFFQFVVLPGMRIEAANTAEGDAHAIALELRKSKAVRMRLRRADGPSVQHAYARALESPKSVVDQKETVR